MRHTKHYVGMSSKLTQNQEMYCQARLRGLSQRKAYREAYPSAINWKDNVVDVNASKLEADAKISLRLARLNEQAANKAVLSKKRLLNRLDRIADKAEEHSSIVIQHEDKEVEVFDTKSADVLIKATKELLPYAQDDEKPQAMQFVSDFALLIGKAFVDAHRSINYREHVDYWFGGGRGSLKSSFASLEVVYHIERNPDHHAVVLMKRKNNLRDAAYAQIVWAIRALGLEDDYDLPTSTLRIVKKSTGQLILFNGCDNPHKMKSVKVPFGRIGICWYEEADQFAGMSDIRTVNQSVTRGQTGDGSEMIRLYTFNPPRTKSCWVNEEMDRRRDKGLPVYSSTYLDAPLEWLGKQFIEDAEELKETDPQAYDHEYMGLPVGLGGSVFDLENRVIFREITDEEIAQFDNPRAGQDFGWFPDPWAFVLGEWQPGKRTLLTYCEDSGTKLYPNQQAKRIMENLSWPDYEGGDYKYHHIPVLSDDAEPGTIAQQRDTGVNARSAEKGNMREQSYKFLSSIKWVIDPQRCPGLAKEVRSKEFAQNAQGEWLNEIPDGNDHFIDASRYKMMREAKSRYAYRATQEEE